MSEVTEAGKIPRPVLKGRHAQMLQKGLVFALGTATVGAGIFAYYGIYKHHLWWQKYWSNFDHEARRERIADNEEVFMQKWEYWWRTGKWVGNGYVVPPALPEGTNYAEHPRLIPKE